MTRKSTPKTSTEAPRVRSAEQIMSLAWQAYGEGRPREAEALCARLVKARPDHAHGWFLRGLAAATLGKPKLALKHFERVRDAPDLLPALAQAGGRALLDLGDVEAALARFQEALSYRADDASTYYFLGLASLRQGAGEEARRFLRQAAMLEPKLGPAHYELGVMALNAGQAAQAVASFSAAVEHMAGSPEALNNLGLAHQSAGDAEAAEASYRRALELNGNYAEAWFNLGVLLRATRSGEANACFSRARKLNPALAEVLPDHDD